MVRTVLLAASTLALLAPPPPADTVRDLLAAAAKLRDEKPLDAAQLYGQALAKSQGKGGTLALEQEAADAFVEFVRTREPGKRRDAALAALSKMDPKHRGAFVSAPVLAGEILLEEIGAADGAGLSSATSALATHSGGGSGKALQSLGLLGEALQECRKGDPAKAETALKGVFTTAAAEGWLDVAFPVGVERTAVRLRLGDDAGAAAALGEAAALATPRTERRHLELFQALVEARLKDAPEAVLKPWKDAMGYMKKDDPGVAGPGAGAGAAGAAAGKRTETPFGMAAGLAGKWRNIATVVRTKASFEMRVGWDPKFRKEAPDGPGVLHLEEGGLTLAFAGGAVALRHGRPASDSESAPGADSAPVRWRAWYRLARGETWSLGKEGEVRIAGR